MFVQVCSLVSSPVAGVLGGVTMTSIAVEPYTALQPISLDNRTAEEAADTRLPIAADLVALWYTRGRR